MNVRPLYNDAGDEWWMRAMNGGRGRYGGACLTDGGWLEMTAGVVGPDHGPTPSDLSSRSLLQWRREREREREREPGIRIFFFAFHTSPQAAKRRSFRGGRLFFFFSHNYSLYM